MQHWCFLRYIAKDATGMSPFLRVGKPEFTGMRLPFGVGVFYYLNKTRYKHQHKCQSRLNYGVLVGYGFELGNTFGMFFGEVGAFPEVGFEVIKLVDLLAGFLNGISVEVSIGL